jgi:selenide,water dikinase
VLTKPLGTGTQFAADMRHRARGHWVHNALEQMSRSNADAAGIVADHGARAATDVTGFGLLGHLVEMTRPSDVDAVVDLEALPVLEGAMETLEAGIFSSLQPDNVRLRRAIRNQADIVDLPRYPLLFDPQTAGGLLAGVPEENVEDCLQALREAGYGRTKVVGRVEELSDELEPVVVTSS